MITGESGTGKELVARAVHGASERSRSPLVSLNCPALSAHLMESELFGHVRGAFTGADSPRTGRFELADQGTILLDEITEVELPLQAKLLRVLQERTFERVGSSESSAVDVRVLATTNRDLPVEVAAGRFRADLYYRLNVVPLAVPPLRERREDIPELAAHFLAKTAERLHKESAQLTADAHDLLVDYAWPGNVRELENIITRASVLVTGQRQHFRRRLAALADRSDRRAAAPAGAGGPSRHALGRHGTAVDRSHARPVWRPSGAHGGSAGDRHSHLVRQAEGIRLRAAGQEFPRSLKRGGPGHEVGRQRWKQASAFFKSFVVYRR